MLDFMSKGGVLVIPIGLCSVAALALFIERLLFFWQFQKGIKNLQERLTCLIRDAKFSEAMAIAASRKNALGRIYFEILSLREHPDAIQQEAIREAYERESKTLSARLQLLATIGNIAPLLGLLGTITGMIKAFMVIQQAGGKVDAAALAGGIWEAMLTTALGLAVALPVMMGHSYLVFCVESRESMLKQSIVSYLKETSAP